MNYGWRGFLLLAALLLFGFLFALGTRGLNEPDEGRYANMAGEILEDDGHGWLDPVLSDIHHYDKPPMIYWVTALSIKAFGYGEAATRLPSVSGAILSLAGLGWAAWRLYGAKTAWWSLLVCGTMVQFWALARWLTPDMFLTGWVTLAIAVWVECRHRDGSWKWWLASLFCWSMAWWTKATPSLIPLLGLYVALIVTQDERGRKALRFPLLLPAIILLGSPWYILMMQEHRDLVHFFFGRELVGRMAGHVDGRKGPIYYYLIISLLAWLPWWPWAATAAKCREWRQGWWRRSPELWIVVSGLAVFSLAASKLPTYTLILAPWAALGMTRLILPLEERRNLRLALWGTAAVWMALSLTTALLIVSHESKLGRNSSLREVLTYLQQHGAKKVYADSYWPSLEVYFGEEVYYVTKRDLVQTKADEDVAAESAHFLNTEKFNRLSATELSGSWLIHYRKQRLNLHVPSKSPVVIGDFELIPLTAE
ncbi:MAG: glycosyltransferase family 39 protein [Verrucomicrobiales bacterium]|jgi:4-amino-4-deoxy-L-arabinose transferase-like glycosyltransferase|nr:glycosyltransferase family 39 protein [Verrucomicrobiales bacterium]